MAVSIGRTENTCIINLDKKVADKKKGSSPSAKQEPNEGKVTSAQVLILPRTT
jgi:hypothetical protein